MARLDRLQKLTAAGDAAVLVRLAGQRFTGHDKADHAGPANAAIANGIIGGSPASGIDQRAAWTENHVASVLPKVGALLRARQHGLRRFLAVAQGCNP